MTPLRCATVNRQNDPHAATVVLPRDELAARRQSKRQAPLALSSLQKVQRLLVASELRKRAERDE